MQAIIKSAERHFAKLTPSQKRKARTLFERHRYDVEKQEDIVKTMYGNSWKIFTVRDAKKAQNSAIAAAWGSNLKLNEWRLGSVDYDEIEVTEKHDNVDETFAIQINKNDDAPITTGSSSEPVFFYSRKAATRKAATRKAATPSPRKAATRKAATPVGNAKCRPDQVLNHKTGRCVARTGKIGMAILAARGGTPAATPAPAAKTPSRSPARRQHTPTPTRSRVSPRTRISPRTSPNKPPSPLQTEAAAMVVHAMSNIDTQDVTHANATCTKKDATKAVEYAHQIENTLTRPTASKVDALAKILHAPAKNCAMVILLGALIVWLAAHHGKEIPRIFENPKIKAKLEKWGFGAEIEAPGTLQNMADAANQVLGKRLDKAVASIWNYLQRPITLAGKIASEHAKRKRRSGRYPGSRPSDTYPGSI